MPAAGEIRKTTYSARPATAQEYATGTQDRALHPACVYFTWKTNIMKLAPSISKICVALVVLVAIGSNPGGALAAPGPLDGKVFIADAGVTGKAADEEDDVITFANGTFHSSICDQWGYNKGEYTESGAGDALSFEVETVSEKDGRLRWKGVIKGDAIEGSFIHLRKPSFFRPNRDPVEHWFKGKVKS